jgi:hypothetical protein
MNQDPRGAARIMAATLMAPPNIGRDSRTGGDAARRNASAIPGMAMRPYSRRGDFFMAVSKAGIGKGHLDGLSARRALA